ncbi:zinc finger CCCH domain-containing protein 13-like [Diabrotica virgifera virgifera]|uniref:Trichohyalin-like n=1 Tax=Diabrotica virgifera virgifera TaxID=50390 RepID=A0ABM5IR01_DIAVI|nr:zinc finger CCCH domain-containing protein 13-like [Diabrotica virgifera virgifera]
MTYVSDNVRFTLDESCIKPLKRRSEGRLKAISSNEDFRSWNYTVEDRRRQILDVVKNDVEKCGLLTTAVLHALTLKSKAKLTKSLKQLWEFIMSRDLTEEEKEHLTKLQKEMGYACSQVISNNCPCEGNYDVICACEDETGAKQRDRILNVVHSFESKSVPVDLSREFETLKCECSACSDRARKQFSAKTTICGGQKGPSDPKKRKIMKAAVSSDQNVFSKTRKHYDRPDTASSDVPSSKRSSRPDTVSGRPRPRRMDDISSADDTDAKIKDSSSTSSDSKPISSPMYTGYEDSPYTTKIKDKSSRDDTDSKIKEFSSFSTDDDSKPVSPSTRASSGYQDDPYRGKTRDTSRDPYRDKTRDTSRDPYRDQTRDTSRDDPYRDKTRDTSRDEPYRGKTRDTSRDPYRDQTRDTSRDDPYRDKTRDPSREEPYTDKTRDTSRDPYRDKTRDTSRDDPYRDPSRDEPYTDKTRDTSRDPYRDKTRDTSRDDLYRDPSRDEPYTDKTRDTSRDPYRDKTGDTSRDVPYIDKTRDSSRDPYRDQIRDTSRDDPYRDKTRDPSRDEPYTDKTRDTRTPQSSGYKDEPYRDKARDTSRDDPYRDTTRRTSRDEPYKDKTRDTSRDEPYRDRTRDTSRGESYRDKGRDTIRDEPYRDRTRDTSRGESYRDKTRDTSRDEPYRDSTRRTSRDEPFKDKTRDTSRGEPYRDKTRDTSTPRSSGYKDVSKTLSEEKGEGPHIYTAERAVSSTVSVCSIDCQCRTDIKTVGLRTEPDLTSREDSGESILCPCRDKATCTPVRPTRTVKLGVHSTPDESSEPYKKLKSKYAELECVCKEQQENIRNIIKERDILQNKYQKVLSEPIDSNKDTEDLEKHLSEASPEIEASMINNQLEMLRQNCLKLKAAEEENEILRREKLESKRQGKPRLRDSKASGAGVSELDDMNKDDCDSCISLKTKIKILERRLAQCSKTVPEEFEIFNNQSLLDNALAERDQMQKKMERIHELEAQLDECKKKAARTEELENQLMRLQREQTTNYDLRKVQSKCVCVQRELENVKAERDAILKRLDLMKEEMERLRTKAKEAEVLLIERDKLQIKMNGMSNVQTHNENLRIKCKCLENAANERDMYKRKYEEQLNLDTQVEVEDSAKLKRDKALLKKQVGDLQSCIVEQDGEIKRLMEQIDSLIKNKEEVQARMKETLMNMRAEIEKKDRLITAADKKLETLQAQLKSSIQGVSVEATVYKTRIQELEMELNDAKNQLRKMDDSILRRDTSRRSKSCEYEAVCAMKKELQAANDENRKLQEIAKNMAILTGDEHVQKMLKQSQYAVRKVLEELNEQYKEWDDLKKERRKPRSAGSPSPNREEELNRYRSIQHSNNQQGKDLNRSEPIPGSSKSPREKDHNRIRQELHRSGGIPSSSKHLQETDRNRLRQGQNRSEGIQSYSNDPQEIEYNRLRQDNDSQTNRQCQGELAARMMYYSKYK